MTNKLSGYSTTPANNNAASPGGWPEGMTAGSLNNSDREFAARVREFYEDSQWIDFGHTIVSSTGSSIKLSGDVTAIYTAGRAIRVNQDSSMDGWVSASAYSAPDTSITVTGFTVAAPTQVEVGAVKDHTALPNNLSITVASLAATSLSTTSLAVSGTLTAFTTASITTAVIGSLTVTLAVNANGDALRPLPVIDAKTSGTAASFAWPSGVKAIKATAIGGGGAGGAGGNATTDGSGGGGGAGGTCIKRLTYVSGVDAVTYTVGAAGAASTFSYNGTTYTGAAGSAGTNASGTAAGTGGAGGAATNGDLNIPGGRGDGGGISAAGGRGGSTVLGMGGGSGRYNGGAGAAGAVYGSGGGGGGSNNGTGGAGAAGIVIFEY